MLKLKVTGSERGGMVSFYDAVKHAHACKTRMHAAHNRKDSFIYSHVAHTESICVCAETLMQARYKRLHDESCRASYWQMLSCGKCVCFFHPQAKWYSTNFDGLVVTSSCWKLDCLCSLRGNVTTAVNKAGSFQSFTVSTEPLISCSIQTKSNSSKWGRSSFIKFIRIYSMFLNLITI